MSDGNQSAQLAPQRELLWKDQQYHFLPGGTHCAGCGLMVGSKLTQKTLYEIDPDVLILGGACGTGNSSFSPATAMGQAATGMYAAYLAAKRRNIKRNLVGFLGEGGSFDMGLDDTEAAIERGVPCLFVVYDNEGFCRSGGAPSSGTPMGASGHFWVKGKPTWGKYTPLMMAFSQAQYVATASIAYPKDLIEKLKKGMENKPSIVWLHSPCVATWGYAPDRTVQVARLAVQTGLFPLWEYTRGGRLTRTYRVDKPESIEDYARLQQRFRHLDEEGLEALEAHAKEINDLIDGVAKGLGQG